MSKARGGAARLRIIGGEWRGRRLEFVPVAGLRPTPDRVRETLFNWLQGEVEGRRCLDLFAGSGALGIEAASRGAREVVLVEQDRRAAQRLKEHSRVLGSERLQVHAGDALQFLKHPARPFDLVFLDPPFGKGLLTPLCQCLEQGGWLSPEALIYCESESRLGEPEVPANWRWFKARQTGDVAYRLARRSPVLCPAATS